MQVPHALKQVAFLSLAALAGAGLGMLLPGASDWLERLVWPTLAVLLYATFCQVRPGEAIRALGKGRYLAATLTANFAIVPAVVWLLSGLLPQEPGVRLGVLMVLLVPCTDWFMTFTYLGRGDVRLAVATTPLMLLAQFGLLPLYLLLFLGEDFTSAVRVGPFIQAFLGLIAAPFFLAVLTQRWGRRSTSGAEWLRFTERLPTPLLALTLFLIAASQIAAVTDATGFISRAVGVFAAYLVVAALVARLTAAVFRLDTKAGRTLAFSTGTRNSFVVLPLALALPTEWNLAVAVVALQSLVELGGMVGFLWIVPRWLFPRPE